MEEKRMQIVELYIDDWKGDLELFTREMVILLHQIKKERERLVVVIYDEPVRKVKVGK
jgi:hypothetical protein